MDDTTIDADRDPALTPEARVKLGAFGTPVVLADGNTWLLADGGLMNDLDPLRDKLDDDARLLGSVSLTDVAEMAAQLLVANYDLTIREVFTLLGGAIDQKLADAVHLAVFGPNTDSGRRTYSDWAASALIANGIDPDRVPSRLMPLVLGHLERGGRVIPKGEYIESAEAARKLAGIRARALRQAPPASGATGSPAPKPDAPAPLAAVAGEG